MTDVKAGDTTGVVVAQTAPQKADVKNSVELGTPLPENKEVRYPLSKPQVGWDPLAYNSNKSVFLMKTWCGLPFDEVSSALQKACRRGLRAEARQWALDMWLASPVAATNAWNRLMTIAVEDIGPADPQVIWLVNFCRLQCNVSTVDRGSSAARDNTAAGGGHEYARLWVCTAADILASAKKTRANDWMCAWFKEGLEGKKVGTPDQLVEGIKTGLREKKIDIAWYYTNALHGHGLMSAIKRFYQLDTWKGNTYVSDLSTIGLDKNWFKSGKHRLLLIHILNTYLRGTLPSRAMTSQEAMAALVERKVNATEYQDMIKNVLARDTDRLIGMPDWALDKHTARGKKMGRGIQHFLQVGSKLVNTDDYWESISAHFIKTYWVGRTD